MKYSVNELKRKLTVDNKIEGTISFKDKISEEILDVADTKISGTFDYIKESDEFVFFLHVKTSIMAPCALTLKPVKVLVDFDTELIYTFKVTDDDSFLIEGNTIDLDEIIWSEIYLHLPVRVLSEGAVFHQEDTYEIKKENPFSSLYKDKEE
ncbi:MAG: DUF177 domain-containing protein [Bacillales bacterium]|nr:DUF177 domain-containing protein [Bacillales bacterium]